MNLHPAKTILLALSLTTSVFAQTTDDESEIRFYDVEIAIFKNLKVPRSREFVLPVGSPSASDLMLDLSSPASIDAARELGYEVLPAEQLRLGDIVGKLLESERYQVLVHTGWRQPGVELEQALPVWIRGGRVYGNEYMSIDSRIGTQQQQLPFIPDTSAIAEPLPLEAEPSMESTMAQPSALAPGELYELEGKITVALGRFLHTYADLVLRRPRREAEIPTGRAAEDQRLASADTWILNNHHLKEHRRMRSRNLHYLDNPEFSLLVLINRYEPDEAVDGAPLDTDAGIVLDSDLTPTEAAETLQDQ